MNKTLKSLNKQIQDLQSQKLELENNLFLNSPELKSARNKIGKFFRYRNCYSCPEKPEDYWFLYFYVKDIDLEASHYNNGNINISFITDQFQIDKNGMVLIESNKNQYQYSLSEEVKDMTEINRVIKNIQEKLNDLIVQTIV